jgi:hypothetical protein
MGAGESTYPGACLTCGGDVISRNSGKEGVCVNCGPVAFDVVLRKGQQVEGFSTNAWRQIQEQRAEVTLRRSKDLESTIDDLLFERRAPLADVERLHPMTPFDILPGLPPYGPSALPFRAGGLWWRSGRISWNGFRKLVKSGTILTGESYSSLDHVWSPFALDLTSGVFAGGSILWM